MKTLIIAIAFILYGTIFAYTQNTTTRIDTPESDSIITYVQPSIVEV